MRELIEQIVRRVCSAAAAWPREGVHVDARAGDRDGLVCDRIVLIGYEKIRFVYRGRSWGKRRPHASMSSWMSGMR